MKKKMLYVMHIDWNWIKQRPQFLAEELAKFYDLTVVYTYGYRRKLLVHNQKNNINRFVALYRLPHQRFRNTLFGRIINDTILKLQFRMFDNNYDYVWLTSPTYVNFIKNRFKKSKIIYDCMDDNIGIKDDIERNKILKLEHELLSIADIVFVSSDNLKNVIKKEATRKKFM
ncbi:MAG: teichuronic acid biosynthesis glycosyltransferase TuaH [Thermosipho sp. (in: thermotogales)]|nr:teichuronic acid biosynthesis glycosyltransferase TuaH [Thermosipho sp. (in: thermotogales)]